MARTTKAKMAHGVLWAGLAVALLLGWGCRRDVWQLEVEPYQFEAELKQYDTVLLVNDTLRLVGTLEGEGNDSTSYTAECVAKLGKGDFLPGGKWLPNDGHQFRLGYVPSSVGKHKLEVTLRNRGGVKRVLPVELRVVDAHEYPFELRVETDAQWKPWHDNYRENQFNLKIAVTEKGDYAGVRYTWRWYTLFGKSGQLYQDETVLPQQMDMGLRGKEWSGTFRTSEKEVELEVEVENSVGEVHRKRIRLELVDRFPFEVVYLGKKPLAERGTADFPIGPFVIRQTGERKNPDVRYFVNGKILTMELNMLYPKDKHWSRVIDNAGIDRENFLTWFCLKTPTGWRAVRQFPEKDSFLNRAGDTIQTLFASDKEALMYLHHKASPGLPNNVEYLYASFRITVKDSYGYTSYCDVGEWIIHWIDF